MGCGSCIVMQLQRTGKGVLTRQIGLKHRRVRAVFACTQWVPGVREHSVYASYVAVDCPVRTASSVDTARSSPITRHLLPASAQRFYKTVG